MHQFGPVPSRAAEPAGLDTRGRMQIGCRKDSPKPGDHLPDHTNMNKFIVLVIAVVAWMSRAAEWQYPATKTVDTRDTYFGRTYKDPYRWLENLKDKEVEAWFKAQAESTDKLLAKIPGR